MKHNKDFSTFNKIHFVGIGGVSMSALASIMKLRGKTVTGSDMSESAAVRSLMAEGIEVSIGHSADNIKDAELVVYTAAVSRENPELVAAREAGIEVTERSVFLGYILSGYACPIGVSGTHGKTTCTSMIAQALLGAETDPTVLIGGTLPIIGHNFRVGRSENIVYESCEYVDSFLHFHSKICVILNIEADHLDYFKDLAHIESSFAKYAALTYKDGVVVANGDCPSTRRALANHEGQVKYFSLEDDKADFYANIISQKGYPEFEVYEDGKLMGICKLSVPGHHNVANALAALAACRMLGLDYQPLIKALASFGGACRRFEYKGKYNGVTVVDDYAHHPSEITATLKAAASLGFNEIWCVFQPHTYTRTKMLFDEFATALSLADNVVLLDIYAAREKPDPSVNSSDLATKIDGATYCNSFESATRFLQENMKDGDILITMGAGNVFKLGEKIVM